MLQRHITTTTSFIVSSDESLNKPSSLSCSSACGRSTDSSENMSATTASISDSRTDQSYLSQSSPDSMTNNNNLISKYRVLGQPANGRFSMLPSQPLVPPPPPPVPPSINDKFFQSFKKSESTISQSVQQQISNQSIENHQNDAFYGLHKLSESVNRFSISSDSSYQQQAQSKAFITNNNHSLVQSFHNSQNHITNSSTQRSPTISVDSSSSIPLMPMNVKGMLLHGLSSEEVMRNWLLSIKCDDLMKNFVDHGYDIHLVTRMTPQDLAAIGCKTPITRKKLLAEIRKLNLDYDLPDYKPMILEQWLDTLKLKSYFTLLVSEGYDTVEKVCQLTWEDLEEIGIVKLGHQKRLLLGIDKVQKSLKNQEIRQNESAIYDAHPNHRVSLNASIYDSKMNTIGRVRSGLFQTRSGANLDHRGLPIATMMPALKHISSPIINSPTNDLPSEMMRISGVPSKGPASSDLLTTSEFAKRNPPPPPPARTNSLPSHEKQVIDSNYAAYSFTGPKGAAINNISLNAGVTRSPITPVREAPLPPFIPDRLCVSEKIEEESSSIFERSQTTITSNSNFNPQLADADEFPPPPP